ncbi:DUF4280 domain-containing protein [Chitinophaga polysaccharea]|uniref:PAAR-like protein n=1 Tax=Chitinophaga polysaccharea TaxID=1293035 RepID=UPI001455C559|nr:PAAR-like protein [Chitinophaga polysaccharea]NLR61596.1 DUF4280 domain-containing protein [Chitinophaga polysaccharea]
MADKHFVVQGAVCRCRFGTTSSKLQVLNTNEYMNDHAGSIKPVASSKELGNPFLPATFGHCSLTQNACVPAISKWRNTLRQIVLANNGQILTENSKAYCIVAGTPCIAVTHHGQTLAPITNDTNETTVADHPTEMITPIPSDTINTAVTAAQSSNDQQTTKPLFPEQKPTVPFTVNPFVNHIVRPRTSLSFQASDMMSPAKLSSSSAAATQWLLNGKQVGIGASIMLDGHTHFTIPGKYRITALIDLPPSKPQQARRYFEVKNNELQAIKINDSDPNWIIGKRYTLTAQTLMPYAENLDGPIIWKPYGAGRDVQENAFASQEGTFTISARLKQSVQTLEINAVYATVNRWCFVDQQNIYKARAGWQENIYVTIASPEASNETVTLHLLQSTPAHRICHVKEIGQVKFDDTGTLKVAVNIQKLKPILTAASFRWDTSNLLFAIAQREDSIQFAGMKTICCHDKKYWFPQKQHQLRGAEMGKYLQIKDTTGIVSIQFFDSHHVPAYKVYPYGEKITVHIQTNNLSDETLLFEIWENKFQEEDICHCRKEIRVNDSETCDVLINTLSLKTGKFLEEQCYRSFYVAVKISATDKYLYPAEIADNNLLNPASVSYYQHIKLSDGLHRLLNKFARSNAPVVVGESLGDDESPECPHCEENITTAQLERIFPNAGKDLLLPIANIYNKYMQLTGMNSCWNKAHFFAQIIVECGGSLKIKEGENFNWYWEDLPANFRAFKTAEGRKKAREWGRPVKKPAHPGVSQQNMQHIANYAYGPGSAKGKSLGNTVTGDGWNFRGRGLIQITGREAYAYANSYTIKEQADVIAHPDLVASNMKIATLSAMAFWVSKGLPLIANCSRNATIAVSQQVGKEIVVNGKSNHIEKQHAFDNTTSLTFHVRRCRHKAVSSEMANRYRIDADTFTCNLVRRNPISNKYQYDVYISRNLAHTYILEKNRCHLLPFPETGPNWGRYGQRDKGGDNYIAPEIAAPLFGFFYSLPKNGYNDKLYFNDISAADKRNIGHKGHIDGNDIDIRYPGSSNKPGEVLWSEAMKAYGSERIFVSTLENILSIAKKWNFSKNYAYKKGIANTTGLSTKVHQNHFHLGMR